jgi:iron(III) transport system substrate-binding protein
MQTTTVGAAMPRQVRPLTVTGPAPEFRGPPARGLRKVPFGRFEHPGLVLSTVDMRRTEGNDPESVAAVSVAVSGGSHRAVMPTAKNRCIRQPSGATEMYRTFAKLAAAAAAVPLAALLAAGSVDAQQRTQLLVYTALETDQLKAYEEGFRKSNPDVELRWVRDSTGIITAKLLAEKANPQADVVMGVAASSLQILDSEGLLEAYQPKGFDALNPKFSDAKRPPTWVGMDVWGATVCFNTVEAAKRNIPKPESWKDLTKPVYKGQVTMPHPASSGTGFFDVTAWLQIWGEAEGWKFMDALHENIAQYTHSGSKPCRQSGAGEFVVGISFEYRANQVKASGAPVELVFPKEGLGWDIEAIGIMKASKKIDAAKRLADWAASKEANELYSRNFAIVAHREVSKPLPNVPANYEQMLVKNDFAWAAKNRDAILTEWNKRYNAKAEPK